jgi:hypothetical protein
MVALGTPGSNAALQILKINVSDSVTVPTVKVSLEQSQRLVSSRYNTKDFQTMKIELISSCPIQLHLNIDSSFVKEEKIFRCYRPAIVACSSVTNIIFPHFLLSHPLDCSP